MIQRTFLQQLTEEGSKTMRVLAIDSSGLTATVAVVEDEQTIAEYTVNYKKTHSQTLLPMIDEVKKMIDLDLSSIDAIAVSGGPGSFTGLRIGSATAKGLGLALGKPLIHVPTVDALAYNVYGCGDLICPIMDARRGQVYTGIYRFHGRDCEIIKEQCAISIEELMEALTEAWIGQPELPQEVVFLGDGVPVHQSYIEEYWEKSEKQISFAPPHMNGQRAGSLAMCAMQMYKEGRTETAAEHHPDYLRLSQAEREKAEREKAKSSV